jgi:hypothetical protein
MDAKETSGAVAFSYRIDVRLERCIIEGCGRERELRQRWPKLDRFRNLDVYLSCRQFCRRPASLPLALDARDSAARQLTTDIDSVLTLTRPTIADGVVVVPDEAEEIGANLFEFIPVFGNGQL